jgi:hypothetical protein
MGGLADSEWGLERMEEDLEIGVTHEGIYRTCTNSSYAYFLVYLVFSSAASSVFAFEWGRAAVGLLSDHAKLFS